MRRKKRTTVRTRKAPPKWLEAHKITHRKKREFLVCLAVLGTVTHAARSARICRRTHYDWLDERGEDGNPTPDAIAYAAAVKDAHDQAVDALEREAIRRATEGTLKPVYQGGRKVGTVREYSDLLLIFLMKGANPAKYRERFEHSGPGGIPLPPASGGPVTNVLVNFSVVQDPARIREVLDLAREINILDRILPPGAPAAGTNGHGNGHANGGGEEKTSEAS